MARVTVGGVVQSSLVTAFTITAAFIWKDVVLNVIHLLIPPGEELLYQILAAIFATILVVIAIAIIVKTEKEAEIIIKKIEKQHKENQKGNKK